MRILKSYLYIQGIRTLSVYPLHFLAIQWIFLRSFWNITTSSISLQWSNDIQYYIKTFLIFVNNKRFQFFHQACICDDFNVIFIHCNCPYNKKHTHVLVKEIYQCQHSFVLVNTCKSKWCQYKNVYFQFSEFMTNSVFYDKMQFNLKHLFFSVSLYE